MGIKSTTRLFVECRAALEAFQIKVWVSPVPQNAKHSTTILGELDNYNYNYSSLRWLDTVFNNLGVRQFDTLRFCVFKFHLTDTG